MTDQRPIVRVTENDLLASMQILACIARPHRAASAGELMQQWFWARKRSRREGLPGEIEISIPDKDKIDAKLPALAKDISAGLDAGQWLKRSLMAKSDGVIVRAFGSSFRQLGARDWNKSHAAQIARGDVAETTSRDEHSATAKQRIWTKRRPVAHMALAVRAVRPEFFAGPSPELEALVFDPVWVEAALERAESYAEMAMRHKVLKPGEPWRFIR